MPGHVAQVAGENAGTEGGKEGLEKRGTGTGVGEFQSRMVRRELAVFPGNSPRAFAVFPLTSPSALPGPQNVSPFGP